MAIIPVPDNFAFSKVSKFTLARSGTTLRSKYNAARQTVVYPFAIWILEGKLREYDGALAGEVRAFLVDLDGQKNTFRLPVPGFSAPLSGYNGDAVVNGAVASGARSMAIDGLAPNTPILNYGDFFTVNDEFKMCLAPVQSNGLGQVGALSFKPAMRKPLADNAIVKIQEPTILMHSQDDDIATFSLDPPVRQNSSVSFIEAIEL